MDDPSGWQLVLDNSALILGVVVSISTIATVAQARRMRGRERHALIRRIEVEYSWLVTSAEALGLRAKQVQDDYPRLPGEAFPAPSKEVASLPPAVVDDVVWLTTRAKLVLSYTIPPEHLSPLLDTGQLDALARFIRAHRSFAEVVGSRAADLSVYQLKKGVLRRFCSVAVIHAEQLRSAFEALRAQLGLGASDDAASGSANTV